MQVEIRRQGIYITETLRGHIERGLGYAPLSEERSNAVIGHGGSGRQAASNSGVEAMKAARKRVLIADCHEEVLIALEKMLEDEGFDVTTVWTAKGALGLLDSEVFDLVLVNEYLPDAECEDILKALQQRGARIPCIVMQPRASETSDLAGLEALGATKVVCKYGYRHIVDVVNECLACDEGNKFVA